MKDTKNFGNNTSGLSAELIEQLKGQKADATPVLNKRPDTKNPPKESGEYLLNRDIKEKIQAKIKSVFNPKERQVISLNSPKNPIDDIAERESFYPAESANDVFSDMDRERNELAKKHPRTPAPEAGIDTDYPRKADTNRPPGTPKPGFAAPSTIEELKAEEQKNQQEAEKQDTIPTPVPDGKHRTVSEQFHAPNIYEDATFSYTKRFASPKTPQGSFLKDLERSANRTVHTDILPEDEEQKSDQETLIDIINSDIKP